MEHQVFSIAAEHPPKEGMTISTDSRLGNGTKVHFFSLGPGTDISAETYDQPVLYIGAAGGGQLSVGQQTAAAGPGDLIFVPAGALCGIKAAGQTGFIYTEILMKKEINMNSILKSAEVFSLKNMIDYEKGSIANMDLVSGQGMKFMILSFDEGCALSEHRAPGNALLFALEGKAVIGYEGKQYPIKEGENFRFDKNGLHSVTADGRFKMALLLVTE
ncbi:MAG: cupin domain-containing protein [Eubacteriales bacterium]|nr:cupin domain-containing protein [Eubacteriales bacterium]